jgi:hypothetical protein
LSSTERREPAAQNVRRLHDEPREPEPATDAAQPIRMHMPLMLTADPRATDPAREVAAATRAHAATDKSLPIRAMHLALKAEPMRNASQVDTPKPNLTLARKLAAEPMCTAFATDSVLRCRSFPDIEIALPHRKKYRTLTLLPHRANLKQEALALATTAPLTLTELPVPRKPATETPSPTQMRLRRLREEPNKAPLVALRGPCMQHVDLMLQDDPHAARANTERRAPATAPCRRLVRLPSISVSSMETEPCRVAGPDALAELPAFTQALADSMDPKPAR